MDIYNIRKVSNLVGKQPSYDRLYRFFTGNYSILTKSEINSVEKVLNSQHKEALEVIKSAKNKLK